LAALGGCWWPIEVTASWMQTLANWIPTGWMMGAMHQLINFGNGPASALNAMALLLGSALVLGVFATRNFRYR
ncbi:MAG: ABC-2 type transport system permease protein, partial [Planctomycetota bacterium]